MQKNFNDKYAYPPFLPISYSYLSLTELGKLLCFSDNLINLSGVS